MICHSDARHELDKSGYRVHWRAGHIDRYSLAARCYNKREALIDVGYHVTVDIRRALICANRPGLLRVPLGQ